MAYATGEMPPGAVGESGAGPETGASPVMTSQYIAAPTYLPTVHVSEGGPYANAIPYSQGALSYQPAPASSSYIARPSYQPPPMYGGAVSYTPPIVEGVPQMMSSSGMPPVAYSSQVVVQQPGQNPGSYVSAPGPPPPKLTEGIPDPTSVEKQKLEYSKSIEAQLRQETGALAQRNQAQKQSLAQMVQQQKAQYNLQMDQYLQQQAMAVDQQANAEMMMLQEAAMAQKMALEQQAAGLTLEYQQRKAQEEMMAREYQIQKQYFDAEQKLAAQYQKQHGADGRLSEQQLAMGHAAIASQQNLAGPSTGQYAPPMTVSTRTLPPVIMNSMVQQPGSFGVYQGQPQMYYGPQPQPQTFSARD